MAWTKTIGILGGMGPAAHMLLERHLLQATSGDDRHDQDRPPWVVLSATQMPDRTTSIQHGATLTPQLTDALTRLAAAGADFVVVACITAHGMLPPPNESPLPVLNLVDCTLASLNDASSAPVGLLCTRGTRRQQLFSGCAGGDREVHYPDDVAMNCIMDVVYGSSSLPGIKQIGPDPRHWDALEPALQDATEHILGCTELSLLHDAYPRKGFIDPLQLGASAALKMASR